MRRTEQRLSLIDVNRCAAGPYCTVASPKGYYPKQEIIAKAQEIGAGSGATLTLTHDVVAAVRGADAGAHRCLHQHGV